MSTDLTRDSIERLLKVRNKSRKVVKFKFNPVQERYWKSLSHRDIILKARQQGFSTLILCWFLNECLTVDNTQAVIISHDKEMTQKLLQRVRLMLKWLREDADKKGFPPPRIGYETKDNISFPETNSEMYIGTAGTKSFGRGDTVTHLHASEVAFWENPVELMTGLLQSVPIDGYVVIECTANGIGNYFHRQWKKSKTGESVFKSHFFPWHENPEYEMAVPAGFVLNEEERMLQRQHRLTERQLAWRRWKISEFDDPELFKQEYPITDTEAFLSSGRPYFSRQAIAELDNNAPLGVEPVIGNMTRQNVFQHAERGYMTVWKFPEVGYHYSIGADVAEGVAEGDYSCAMVVCNETMEHVATWHGHNDPDLFARDLFALGRYYHNAVIGPEVNNHGIVVITNLRDWGYPALYTRQDFDLKMRKNTRKFGWRTDSKSRPIMLDYLAQVLREHNLLTYDRALLDECMSFKRNNKGRPEAEKGAHDDRVIAMAIALQMVVLHPRFEQEEDELPEHQPMDALAGY